MRTIKRALAATELVLIFPAALFMTALFVRNIQPQQFEPARTAAHIVNWYAARTHLGLWVFLMALPFTVLLTGAVSLMKSWKQNPELRSATRSALNALRAQWAVFVVAAATAGAATILAIVALHLLTD